MEKITLEKAKEMYFFEFREPFFLYELEGYYPTEEEELIKLMKACCDEDKPIYEYLKIDIDYKNKLY